MKKQIEGQNPLPLLFGFPGKFTGFSLQAFGRRYILSSFRFASANSIVSFLFPVLFIEVAIMLNAAGLTWFGVPEENPYLGK